MDVEDLDDEDEDVVALEATAFTMVLKLLTVETLLAISSLTALTDFCATANAATSFVVDFLVDDDLVLDFLLLDDELPPDDPPPDEDEPVLPSYFVLCLSFRSTSHEIHVPEEFMTISLMLASTIMNLQVNNLLLPV